MEYKFDETPGIARLIAKTPKDENTLKGLNSVLDRIYGGKNYSLKFSSVCHMEIHEEKHFKELELRVLDENGKIPSIKLD